MKKESNATDIQEITDLYDMESARKSVGSLFSDDEEEEGQKSREPLPTPKPALKVNVNVPHTSPSARTRAVQSRYDVVEAGSEDDGLSEFRERYSKERTERRKKPEEPGDSSRTPRRRPRNLNDGWHEEPYVEAGISGAGRGIIIGLAVLFLMLMLFLIYRNNILSSQIEEYREAIAAMPADTQIEMNLLQIELEQYKEQLSAAQAEITRLRTSQPEAPPVQEPETPATPEPPPEPAATPSPPPPAPVSPAASGESVVHVVQTGDSLYRISTRYYGNGLPSSRQRIIDANNITNPDTIQIGMPLTIPMP
jgi:LysM repeat protein